MKNNVRGIHHITAIAENAKRNYEFYTGVQGLRFIKKTVNFDDPGTHHFYFGDEARTPGTILTLEQVARHAKPWGGVAAFTGGLIGDKIYPENYKGSFENSPVFIGSSDPDPHIPVERVHETTRVLGGLQASVKERIYPGLGHTISQEEIEVANHWVFQKKNSPADKKL